MRHFFREQWTKYKTRKTKTGIVIDFLFLVFFIAMLHPMSRTKITSFVIKYTLVSPNEVVEQISLDNSDYQWRYIDSTGQINHFSNLKGKVIFLNFWATWRPPCVAEFSSIQKLYTKFGEQVEFILISTEENEVINAFLKKNNYDVKIYSPIDKVPEILSSNNLPTTFVISKSGRIIIDKKGVAKWNSDKVINLIEKLIAE